MARAITSKATELFRLGIHADSSNGSVNRETSLQMCAYLTENMFSLLYFMQKSKKKKNNTAWTKPNI